jgi:hypothetical protein
VDFCCIESALPWRGDRFQSALTVPPSRESAFFTLKQDRLAVAIEFHALKLRCPGVAVGFWRSMTVPPGIAVIFDAWKALRPQNPAKSTGHWAGIRQFGQVLRIIPHLFKRCTIIMSHFMANTSFDPAFRYIPQALWYSKDLCGIRFHSAGGCESR